jgi:RNA 2',3'-cyclic 3'-phosphodiesterase
VNAGTSARLFAALELPAEARVALAGWAAKVADRQPAIRLVPVASLHVTLVFLGAQPPGEVAAIADAVTATARPVDPLEITRAAWLPPRRPGVLVADLNELGRGTALAMLQADLVTALSPWHEPETRGFRPHVTVARVRRGERLASAERLADPPTRAFATSALVLYRSHPGGGGGPRYEAVARAPLV